MQRQRLAIRKRRLDGPQSRMKRLHDEQRLPHGVRDHVGVREAILLKLTVKDLDLKLKCRGIGRGPEECLLVADTCFTQRRVANSREMIAAEHVAELVLVPEPLV